MKVSFSTIVVSLFLYSLSAQENIVSVISLNTTVSYEHISIHANVEGDDNLNASMQLSYKLASESVYKDGAECMRAHPSMEVDGSALNRNFFAGSVMFLQPGEKYDIKVEIHEPDGVNFLGEIELTTKALKSYDNLIEYYAVPGSGGGTGTAADPFLGLQEAADNISAGSKVIVADGIYSPFEIMQSGAEDLPIIFQAETLHGATVDGAGTDRGAITIGAFDTETGYIHIDGFQIKGAEWGIDAQNTSNIIIKNNKLSDVNYGYVNRREQGVESNQYITNNEFIGRTFWPQSGIPSGRAIDLRGNNHVVSYNSISNFGDGVSLDGPPYGSCYGIDIHHNDLINIIDDFIEVDGMVSNARIYRNRGVNGRAGVSIAPVYGGPCYIFRNEFYNVEISTFKMNRSPAGLYIVHNTGVKSQNAMSSPAGWQETILRNNILCGTRYCFEEFGLVDGSNDDWNYNAYFSTRDAAVDPWFKWNDNRYHTIEELQAGEAIEADGIAIDMNEFNNASVPTVYESGFSSADFDLQLVSNASSRNTGVSLPNINDPFVSDGSPDRGAFEYGEELPKYGPDFSVINSTELISSMDFLLIPNPVSNFIEIQTDHYFSESRIYTIDGILVNSFDEQKFLQFQELNSGLYYLVLYDANGRRIGVNKFVVK